MIYDELVKYIQESLDQGVSKEEIRALLVKYGGWGYDDIKEAFKMVSLKKKTAHSEMALRSGVKTAEPVPLVKKEIIEDPQENMQVGTPSPLDKVTAPKEALPLPEYKEPLELNAPEKTKSVSDNELLDIGSLFAETWSLYKKRLVILLSLYLIPVPLILPLFLIPEEKLAEYPAFILVMFLLFSFFFFVVFSAQLFALKDEKIGFLDSYVLGFSKILSLWWVTFLVFFLTFGASLLFLIPGVLFSIWFSFSYFVLVSEGLGGMNAIERSRELFKGRGMGVFLRLFVGSVFFAIFSEIFAVLSEATHYSLGVILNLFIITFSLTYSYVLYKNVASINKKEKYVPVLKNKIYRFVVAVLGYIIFAAFIYWMPGYFAKIINKYEGTFAPDTEMVTEETPFGSEEMSLDDCLFNPQG